MGSGDIRKSFLPQANGDAETLILGSMPGEESLRQQRYYAHPQNAFWPIMGRLLGFDPAIPYEQRLETLAERRIALWDVLASCTRQGSMDSDIKDGRPNDFKALFANCPKLKRVICNGGTAFKLFAIHAEGVAPEGCRILKAPSTSPAYASMPFEAKLEAWKASLAAH